jgi:hypothetical protein
MLCQVAIRPSTSNPNLSLLVRNDVTAVREDIGTARIDYNFSDADVLSITLMGERLLHFQVSPTSVWRVAWASRTVVEVERLAIEEGRGLQSRRIRLDSVRVQNVVTQVVSPHVDNRCQRELYFSRFAIWQYRGFRPALV